jgi:hypothetical protein
VYLLASAKEINNNIKHNNRKMNRDLNPGLPDYGLLLIQAGLLLAGLRASRTLKSYLVSG